MPKGASQVSNDPDFVKPTKYTKNQGDLHPLVRAWLILTVRGISMWLITA